MELLGPRYQLVSQLSAPEDTKEHPGKTPVRLGGTHKPTCGLAITGQHHTVAAVIAQSTTGIPSAST